MAIPVLSWNEDAVECLQVFDEISDVVGSKGGAVMKESILVNNTVMVPSTVHIRSKWHYGQ